MYRKKENLVHYNILLNQGGLGDLIACLPAIKYILTHHKQVFLHLYCHDYAVDLCKKVFKGEQIVVTGMSKAKTKFNDKLPTRSPYIHNVSNLSSNMVDHAFYTIVHNSVSNEHKNYLQLDPIDVSEFNLPEKYVVITTGFTAKVREWKPKSIYETAEYCISKGYTPVYLGRSETKANLTESIKGTFLADYSNGINLIDKTDLFQAHSIMSGAKAVLGLDNGLLHLAAMSKVPIVYGFTTVIPEHRLPYRDNIQGKDCYVVMPTKEELACIGCQSLMSFASTSHCFTTCFYKDLACLELMTADKWISQLDKVFNPKLTPQEKAEQAYQSTLNMTRINNKLRELGLSVDMSNIRNEE